MDLRTAAVMPASFGTFTDTRRRDPAFACQHHNNGAAQISELPSACPRHSSESSPTPAVAILHVRVSRSISRISLNCLSSSPSLLSHRPAASSWRHGGMEARQPWLAAKEREREREVRDRTGGRGGKERRRPAPTTSWLLATPSHAWPSAGAGAPRRLAPREQAGRLIALRRDASSRQGQLRRPAPTNSCRGKRAGGACPSVEAGSG